MQDINMNK